MCPYFHVFIAVSLLSLVNLHTMTYSDCGYGSIAEFALEHLKTAREGNSIQSIIIYQEEDFDEMVEPLIDLLVGMEIFSEFGELEVRHERQALEFSKLEEYGIRVVSFLDMGES